MENRRRCYRPGKQTQCRSYNFFAPLKFIFLGQFRPSEGMVELAGDKNAVCADLLGDGMQGGHTDCGNAAAFKFL